jgi:hypothetical protein
MRGFRVIPRLSSDECAAGALCPFARRPRCGAQTPSSASGCPIGDACLSREWLYDPPPRVFDVRHPESFTPNASSVCFGAVHSPQQEDFVEYEQCCCVTLQGKARRPPLRRSLALIHARHAGGLLVACYDCGFMCTVLLPPEPPAGRPRNL